MHRNAWFTGIKWRDFQVDFMRVVAGSVLPVGARKHGSVLVHIFADYQSSKPCQYLIRTNGSLALFPLASLLQRLQLKKYLWKTTRIPSVSGLVNTSDLRYSRHRCGTIRSRDLHPGYHNVDL